MTGRHLLVAVTELMHKVVSDVRKKAMELTVLHVRRDIEYSFVNLHHRMSHGESTSAGRIHQKQPQSREACPI